MSNTCWLRFWINFNVFIYIVINTYAPVVIISDSLYKMKLAKSQNNSQIVFTSDCKKKNSLPQEIIYTTSFYTINTVASYIGYLSKMPHRLSIQDTS